jgi:hypothetical protein
VVRRETYNLSHETRTPGRQELTMHRGLTEIARQATALLKRKRRG